MPTQATEKRFSSVLLFLFVTPWLVQTTSQQAVGCRVNHHQCRCSLGRTRYS